MKTDRIADELRKSHCSHPYPDKHTCIGTCKITPAGVILECPTCGDADDLLWADPQYKKLEYALSKIGINAAVLDPLVLRSMLKTLYE